MDTTVNDSGRKGGLKLYNDRGKEYFSMIGRKGQESLPGDLIVGH